MRTSPSYTASYRIEVDEKITSIASIVDAVSATRAPNVANRCGFGWQAAEGGSVTLFEAATLAYWGARVTKRNPARKQRISV